MKPSYYVHELHPTIEYLKWDYGSLSNKQEEEYVVAKMKEFTKDKHDTFHFDELSDLVIQSQKLMREYAKQALSDEGLCDLSAEKCSTGFVSQRDMQRVFDFFKWLCHTYKEFERYDSGKELHLRAILVSLGLVYYLRLGESDREHYAKFLNLRCEDLELIINFTDAFNDELNWYIERMNLPTGIAKTIALKENIFANVACCQTRTPLIIIGEPGTSKTLSFNLVSSTFSGKSSRIEEIKAYHALQPYFYQCSKHTSSAEVDSLFKQAVERQAIYKNSDIRTYCVIFMDEAGLPEERHESLKVLHYHLDRKQVSFVAISNHALDAAKTNRAVSLYRPEASTEDLKILAKELLRSSKHMMINELSVVDNFCQSFSKMMKESQFSSFYGQRDFMHFINYLRKGDGLVTVDIVLHALERNFNGHENFSQVFNYFLNVVRTSLFM